MMPDSQLPTDDHTQAAQAIHIEASRQATFALVSGIFLASTLLIALALLVFGPMLSPTMTTDEYANLVATVALIGLDCVAFAVAYFALSVGNSVRHTVIYVTFVMLLVFIATSWPVYGFISRMFYGGLETVFGS